MNMKTVNSKLVCSFRNLSYLNDAQMIVTNIRKTLNTRFNTAEFCDWRNDRSSGNDEYEVSLTSEQIQCIILELNLFVTTPTRSIWFSVRNLTANMMNSNVNCTQKKCSKLKVQLTWGSMISFYEFSENYSDLHPSILRVQQNRGTTSCIHFDTDYGYLQMKIPFDYIRPEILVSNHSSSGDGRVQCVLMLDGIQIIKSINSKKQQNENVLSRIVQSSDLLICFSNQKELRQFFNNLQIFKDNSNYRVNFVDLQQKSLKNGKNNNTHAYKKFETDHGFYGMNLLNSLGALYTDRVKAEPSIDSELSEHFKKSPESFYDLCAYIWSNLRENHCLAITHLIDRFEKSRKHYQERGRLCPSIKITPSKRQLQPMHKFQDEHRAMRKLNEKEGYCWLLVSFNAENGDELTAKHLKDETVSSQYRAVLDDGLLVPGKGNEMLKFHYFGSSPSQLKEKKFWFLSLPSGKHSNKIDEVLSLHQRFGEFNRIVSTSTYIARIGLLLTSTKSTNIQLNYRGPLLDDYGKISTFDKLFFNLKNWVYKQDQIKYSVQIIDDIMRQNYCFTDGVGTIGFGLASEIAKSIGIDNDVPSAFQIRVSGCKGVLSIDPESDENDFSVKIRPSMIKFKSDDWELHIVDHSRPIPLSLNNQIIRILCDLNPENRKSIESLQNRCAQQGKWHQPEECYLNNMETLQKNQFDDAFKRQKYMNTKQLLNRNKIPLPMNEARSLFGIADELGFLEEGECFIQYYDYDKRNYKIVEGDVIVTKNPCLHPGDVRRLQAVKGSKLSKHIRDCIVFPTQGSRPHFNEMAGSDLDGDKYWVYWGDELKIKDLFKPLAYASIKNSKPHDVTTQRINDFIMETISDNAVSLICDTHAAIADRNSEGTKSELCLEIAEIFSRAIDARKTGEVIELSRVREWNKKFCQKYPEWMEIESKESCINDSINQHLFTQAKSIRFDVSPYRPYHEYYKGQQFERRTTGSDSTIDDEEQNNNDGLFKSVLRLLCCQNPRPIYTFLYLNI